MFSKFEAGIEAAFQNPPGRLEFRKTVFWSFLQIISAGI